MWEERVHLGGILARWKDSIYILGQSHGAIVLTTQDNPVVRGRPIKVIAGNLRLQSIQGEHLFVLFSGPWHVLCQVGLKLGCQVVSRWTGLQQTFI